MPYFYRGHLNGTIYESDDMLDYDDLYCETCGDSDTFLGFYDSYEECMAAWWEFECLDEEKEE